MTEGNDQYQSLKELIEEKEKLVAEGKYLEADEIKQKIEEMKKDSSYQKNDALYESQEKERQDLENDYETERKELEEKWDKKIQDFVEQGKKMEEELVEAHNKKMEEYITTLTTNYPRIKYSSEYLNGRVQENKLAKQERYKEAAARKKINDQLQEQENEKYEFERSENINKNAESLGLKQEQDLNVVRARLARNYDLLVSHKEKDLDRLDNKYKNKKQELIGLQNRLLNISANVNKDRAWEGSNRLTNMALTNKKDGESINTYDLGKKKEANATNKVKSSRTKNKK